MIYVLVGLPTVSYIRPELNLNLIPLISMIDDWKNSILNVLFFIPLGISLPILWNRFRSEKNTVLFAFAASVMIELLQILTFRATDVNDVITNTLGAHLGFLCADKLLKKSPKLTLMVNERNTRELYMLLIVTVLVMFFICPFVSSTLWDMILT